MIQTHLQPRDGAASIGLGGTFEVWVQEIGAPWSAGFPSRPEVPEIVEEPWQRAEREQAAVYGQANPHGGAGLPVQDQPPVRR